ncbi:MAG: hypothetical protein M1822_006774 [Bathelium mastoideum]|nr:MAG: hypothetical protein M1822_006774 [Bathelium mastoideum]
MASLQPESDPADKETIPPSAALRNGSEELRGLEENEDAKRENINAARETSWQKRPENPYNWPWSKRLWQILHTALLSWLVTFGSSVYTPGIPEVVARFGVSETAALLGLSLYVLAMGFAPVLAAPISETLGRKIVYQVSLLGFMLFTLGAGFSQTFAALCACRFFAGMAGGPVLAVGGGSLADMLPIHLRGCGSIFYLFAPFLGPALGPVIGGFVAQYKDWRWTQWVTLFASVPIFLIGLTTKETYQKVVIKRLAKKEGKPLPPQGPSGKAAVRFLLTLTLIRPFAMLLTEPIVLAFSAYNAFTFAVLYAFFAAFPLVFEGVYGFDTSQTGLTFLAIGLGCTMSVATILIIDRKVYYKMYLRVKAEGGAAVAPEHRLYPAMLGSFLLVIGLFWFAWTARKEVHWISPTLSAIPFAWGNLCIFVSQMHAVYYLTFSLS